MAWKIRRSVNKLTCLGPRLGSGGSDNAKSAWKVCGTNSAYVELVNCTITENGAPQGGALDCHHGGTAVLTNTIVSHSGVGVAVACAGGGNAVLECCVVFGNDGGDWVGCVEDQLGLPGNSASDPLFCSLRPLDDRDWTLRSISPCAEDNSECGAIGAWDVGCGDTPVHCTSWGRLKVLFSQ